MNFKIDNLQYCNWSRETFEFNRSAGLDAVHVTIVYHEDYNELLTEIKKWKKLFSPYKIIDSENFIKVSQNPNKVARDTQGLPTVPHNDFGGLNFKCLVSKYLLLMATSPHKIIFSKKNHEKNLLESEKTSDSALSGVVRIEIWSSF